MVKPEIAQFWVEVRQDLRQEFGQDPGRRDRNKAVLRDRLAQYLRLSGRTLKAFLNGNQEGLGAEALLRLFAKKPALWRRYIEAVSASDGSWGFLALAPRADHGIHVQLAFQFEGSDDPPQTMAAHLPPGREGVLTLKIDPGRVA